MGVGRWRLAIVVVLAATAAPSCGKKGPPLPPIVHVPASVDQISARRVGSDVFVTLVVPAENIDKTTPAAIARVEVYGYTGTSQPPKNRLLDVSMHVATVDVLPPETETTEKRKGGTDKAGRAGGAGEKATSAESPPQGSGGTSGNPEARQGVGVTVRDHLEAESLVARALPPPVPQRGRRATTAPVAATAAKEGALMRYYFALGFSPRGIPGPAGMIAEVPLTIVPDAPRDVVAMLASDSVTLTWEPSGGVVGILLERPLPLESSPIDEPAGAARAPGADGPEGPTRYNVYRDIEPLPEAPGIPPAPAADPNIAAPPINAAPLTVLTFSEPLPFLDGRKRCYTVRGVKGTGTTAIEGAASVPQCVVPTDDFAPAAPVGLSTTVNPGSIELTWDPNSEPDLVGYVVLRGEAGDATLTPLTGSVIAETRYVDDTVKPGVRYVYAVKAIDSHLPMPNVSAESARVEEIAR